MPFVELHRCSNGIRSLNNDFVRWSLSAKRDGKKQMTVLLCGRKKTLNTRTDRSAPRLSLQTGIWQRFDVVGRRDSRFRWVYRWADSLHESVLIATNGLESVCSLAGFSLDSRGYQWTALAWREPVWNFCSTMIYAGACSQKCDWTLVDVWIDGRISVSDEQRFERVDFLVDHHDE